MKFEIRPLAAMDLRLFAEEAAEVMVRPYIDQIEKLEVGPRYMAYADDKPVACGGFIPIYDTPSIRALAWGILLPGAKRVFLQLHRVVKKYIDASPYRRIEAHCHAGSPSANKWVELLGFVPEGPPMLFWFPDGSTAQQWVLFR